MKQTNQSNRSKVSDDSFIGSVLENIKCASDFSKEENDKYVKMLEAAYVSALTDEDKKALSDNGCPQFNFSIIKPILFHNLKNVRDSSPSAKISHYYGDDEKNPKVAPYIPIIEVLETEYKNFLERSNAKDVQYNVSKDAFIGGKGIFKLKADYVNNSTFDQSLKISHVEDPTSVYFDPAAKDQSRSDAEYVMQITEFTKDSFKIKFPTVDVEKLEQDQRENKTDFKWISKDETTSKEIIKVADYFYKKHLTPEKIYLLEEQDENGEDIILKESELYNIANSKENDTQTAKILGTEQSVVLVDSREIDQVEIRHVRLCGRFQIGKEKVIPLKMLPFICVVGDRINIKGKTHIQPILKDAIDSQRSRNFAGNLLLDRVINHPNLRVLISNESLPDGVEKAAHNIHEMKVLIYNQYKTGNNGELVPLNPPTIEPAPAIQGAEYLQLMSEFGQFAEKSLGYQFPSLDQQELSGKALYNIAEFMNASIQTFMQNLLNATTEIAKAFIGSAQILSKPVHEAMQMSGIEDLDFVHVDVQSGVNYKLQQQASIERLMELAQANPEFAEFLFNEGMDYLIENLDLNDKEIIKKSYNDYKQKKMQSQQQNPEQMQMQMQMYKEQTDRMDAETRAAKLKLEESAAVASIHKDNANTSINMHKIHAENEKTQTNERIEDKKLIADAIKRRMGYV